MSLRFPQHRVSVPHAEEWRRDLAVVVFSEELINGSFVLSGKGAARTT